MSSTSSEKHNCSAKTQKPGSPLCSKPGTVKFEGAQYCKGHAKSLGWTDKKPLSDSEEKEVKPKAAPKAPKKSAPKATTEQTEDAQEEEHEHADGEVVKPAEKKEGVCECFKADKVTKCANPAKFTCPSKCAYCKGAAACGVHWTSLHKKATISGGKKTSTRKPVDADHKCSHNKKSGDKGPCGKSAFGVDGDGNMACSTHGGPKKADAAGSVSSGGSSTLSGGSSSGVGFFAGVNWPRFSTALVHFTAAHRSGDAEDCADSEAADWLVDLLDLFKSGQPEMDILVAHFAKSGWSKSGDAEFTEVYKHSMLFTIRDLFGEDDTAWLVRMYMNLSKESGEEAAQVASIWLAAAKECELPTAPKASTPSGSSTKGAMVQKSTRKANVKALIQKSKEKAAAKAAAESDEKGKEEASDEKNDEDNKYADLYDEEDVENVPMDMDEEGDDKAPTDFSTMVMEGDDDPVDFQPAEASDEE